MSKINFMGSYSGIDKAQIDKMMEAEKMPLILMSNKKVLIDRQKGAWKDVNTRLKTLFDKMEALKSNTLYESKSAKVGNDKMISVKANEKAIAGRYSVNVKELATSTKMIGDKKSFSESDGKVGFTGSFSISNSDSKVLSTEEDTELAKLETKKVEYDKLVKDGKEISEEASFTKEDENKLKELTTKKQSGTATINISENDTLESIADKVNEASKNRVDKHGNKVEGTGINATVINGRLVLEDSKMGDREIKLENVSDSIAEKGTSDSSTLAKLGLDSTDWATVEADENGDYEVISNDSKGVIQKGRGSKFEVNGIELTADSNSVSDAIRGLELDFNQTGKTTITVAENHEKMEKAINDFVDQYNSTMSFIDDQLKAGDPEVKDSRGALSGDSALMSLQRNLRSLVTDKMNKNKDDKFNIDSPSQLGITTVDKEGTLKFDADKFKAMLKENPNGVKNFFSAEETGFADRFNKNIDKMISSKNGIIKTKDETFDRVLKDLNKQIDNFNDKMERKEAYYIKTFSALDVAMMQAESQMSWLSNQVSAMNPGK